MKQIQGPVILNRFKNTKKNLKNCRMQAGEYQEKYLCFIVFTDI